MIPEVFPFYVLFFIHLGTRKVHILGMTPNPNGAWMEQQARNLCIFFGDLDTPPKYIIHDADRKFTRDFRKILKSEGIKPVRIGPRRANQNSVAERFVRMIKEECLGRFLVFGEDHLRYLIRRFMVYCHIVVMPDREQGVFNGRRDLAVAFDDQSARPPRLPTTCRVSPWSHT